MRLEPLVTKAVSTDSAGRFILRAVPEGSYRVVAAAPGFVVGEVSVEVVREAPIPKLQIELRAAEVTLDTIDVIGSYSIGRDAPASSSALTAERARIDTIAKNVANARTTRMPDTGLPYRREIVSFQPVLREVMGGDEEFYGIQVDEIVPDSAPFEEVFDPTHPDANADGVVLYPNVNTMKEMADLVVAVRSFEANLSVTETIERMAERALRLAE